VAIGAGFQVPLDLHLNGRGKAALQIPTNEMDGVPTAHRSAIPQIPRAEKIQEGAVHLRLQRSTNRVEVLNAFKSEV
jgi:hypothetical protein